jgi:hypothetical protein
MGVIGGHHVKWSKPGSERQSYHVFSPTWKIDLTYTQKQASFIQTQM